MTCPQCGVDLPAAGTECPACGADIGWYVRKPDGSVYGPLDRSEVERCLAEGRILSPDEVRLGSEGDFGPAQPLFGDRILQPPKPTTYREWRPPGAPPPRSKGPGCGACAVFATAAVLVAILVVVAVNATRPKSTVRYAITGPGPGGIAPDQMCIMNLDAIGEALSLYCADYDDRYPAGDGWQRALKKHLDDPTKWTCPAYPTELGYVKNARLAGHRHADLPDPGQTPLLWDAGAAVAGVKPPAHVTSHRHHGSDHVLFADNHIDFR
jgi:hypothetical protein